MIFKENIFQYIFPPPIEIPGCATGQPLKRKNKILTCPKVVVSGAARGGRVELLHLKGPKIKNSYLYINYKI